MEGLLTQILFLLEDSNAFKIPHQPNMRTGRAAEVFSVETYRGYT